MNDDVQKSPANIPGAECLLAAYTPELAASYRVFALQAFGTDAYQALPEYIHWLHCENPLSRGLGKDFAVLLDSHSRQRAHASSQLRRTLKEVESCRRVGTAGFFP